MDIIPGLKGFGTDTRAAYGAVNDPVIFIVTDLTLGNGAPGNSTRNGIPVKTGSFLEAVNYTPPANTGKVIIFEVSGTIGDGTQRSWNLSNRYTSILGQTAPSPGILIKNVCFVIRARDVLMQHLRFRGSLQVHKSCISIGTSAGGGGHYTVDNVVVDHCSASWAHSDSSNILVHQYEYGGTTENITVSNCIISEGIYVTGHGPKGMQASQDTTKVCILNNLFTGNHFRNPYTRGTKLCIVNNLAYNNGDLNCQLYGGDNPPGGTDIAYVGNVAKGGPWGPTGTYPQKTIICLHTLGLGSEIYLLDNRCDLTVNGDSAYVQSSASDWSKVDDDRAYLNGPFDAYRVLSAPIGSWPTGLSAIASSDVKDMVLSSAGCRPVDRDSVDTRLVNEVTNGTGLSSWLTSVPGWPTLASFMEIAAIPSNPHVDSGDGYTNLEKWLHELAADVEGTGVTTVAPTTSVPTTTLTTLPPTTAPPALIVQDVVADFATTPAPTTLYPTTLAPTTAVPELICIKNLKSTIAKEMRINGNLC